jgi:outer membrane protein insertion porin family
MIGLDDFAEERKSYGVSFDWITPMAPLQFVFGWTIDPKDYDATASFEFTMGQRF